MILVTGGCRSGKSEYGEALAKVMGGKKLYIATGQVFDEEMARRVEKHQRRRGICGQPLKDIVDWRISIIKITAGFYWTV